MPKKNKTPKENSPPVQKVYIYVKRDFDEKGCLMNIIKKALLTILIFLGLFMALGILEEIGEFFDKIF